MGKNAELALTPEQGEQVNRLLALYYAQGVGHAAKSLSQAFATLGFTAEVAARQLEQLAEVVKNIVREDEEQYGN